MIRLQHYLHKVWYQQHWLRFALLPLSALFQCVVLIRRRLYRSGVLSTQRMAVPVVVVGNIAAGGTGKTPFVVWLTAQLRARGFSPGIVSRGYLGHATTWPQRVSRDSDPAEVGDEPVLLAARTGCPVMADPDRPRGARELLKQTQCDVLVSDDGLQHYRLARDVEVALIDGERRHGNGYCLPAGPLREPSSRLASVDAVVSQGVARAGEWLMTLVPGPVRALHDPNSLCALGDFAGAPVAAVCGIANPERFFAMLRAAGIEPLERVFADHHHFCATDLDFAPEVPVLMTEKDAVKCRQIQRPNTWIVTVAAEVSDELAERVVTLLARSKTTRGLAP